jgi:DNA-directed RNA polymerase specialized sigma24 family protein
MTHGGDELHGRFDSIVAQYGAALGRLAAVYGGDDGRDDLLQEILIGIWQALPRFRGEASERTFVFRIAHNRGITHRATRRALSFDGEKIRPTEDDETGHYRITRDFLEVPERFFRYLFADEPDTDGPRAR